MKNISTLQIRTVLTVNLYYPIYRRNGFELDLFIVNINTVAQFKVLISQHYALMSPSSSILSNT